MDKITSGSVTDGLLTGALKETKKKIIIADDSEWNRNLLTEILGDSYEYFFAEDGEELLAMLSANVQADILLLDMHMPKMSGMKVLNLMKEYHWNEDLPVIIISAETDSAFIQNAYHLGAIDYIVRPFDTFLVQHRVKNTLRLFSKNQKNDSIRNRSMYLAESERAKKEFFSVQKNCFLFEYDVITKKIDYICHYNEKEERTLLSSSNVCLLNEEDWLWLNRQMRKTTRENPDVTKNVLIPINGVYRWHKMTARSIWVEGHETYVAVVGKFLDIHDEITRKENSLYIEGRKITRTEMVSMRKIFDIVRLVNPRTKDILIVDDDGAVIPNGQKCYEIWNRDEPCQQCTSVKVMEEQKWQTKIETKDGMFYYVLSKYAECQEETCVLELVMCLGDFEQKDEIGYVPDMRTMHIYYRDTLTHAYSRAYFDDFGETLEKAKGLAVVDVDQFKKINDVYGHIVGDAALLHISSVLQSCIRKDDILIRYGGDEFLLMFMEIEENDFYKKLKSIKKKVMESDMQEYPEVKVSISIGGAYCEKPLTKAIEIADKAMYRDKYHGKEIR